jgi:hypothetical protein
MTQEALRMALEAMNAMLTHMGMDEDEWNKVTFDQMRQAIKAAEEALAQPEQEPVAWLITDEKINSLQVDSIQRLVDRARHAHMTDIKLRINGQDEWHQADWLKHLTRTTPPQRTWVGLTDEEIAQGWKESWVTEQAWQSAVWWAEDKLKERNT